MTTRRSGRSLGGMTTSARLRVLLAALLVAAVAWWTRSSPAETETEPSPTGVQSQLWAMRDFPLFDPVVAAGPNSSFALAIGYQRGVGDRLLCSEIRDGQFDAPESVPIELGQFLQLCAVVDGDGALHAFWVDVGTGRPALWHAARSAEGWSTPRELETGFSRARGPRACVDAAGAVWLAFEAELPGIPGREQVDVFLAEVPELDESPQLDPIAVGADPRSDFEPALCRSGDRLWLAWTRCTGIDYEIVARSFDPAKRVLAAEQQVTAIADAEDCHPDLAADEQGGVWLVWDSLHSPNRGRSTSREDEDIGERVVARIRLARLDADGVHAAAGVDGESSVVFGPQGLADNGGTPKLAVMPSGAVSVLFRHFPEPFPVGEPAYPVVVRSWDADGWSALRRLEQSEGPSRPASVAVQDGSVITVFEAGPTQQPPESLECEFVPSTAEELADRGVRLTSRGTGAIGLVLGGGEGGFANDADGTPPSGGSLPTVDQRSHPLVDPLSDPVQNGESLLQIESGERRWNVLWGDLHRHSNRSRCSNGKEPGPESRYTVARDLLFDDFFALTDHSGHLDHGEWWRQSKLIDLYSREGFLALQGYEWSTSDYGHVNVILRRRKNEVVSPLAGGLRTPADLWPLLEEGEALTIPHHPSHVQLGYRWEYHDPRFQTIVEVVQNRGSFEFAGSYRSAAKAKRDGSHVRDGLERGLRFGLIGSTDHGNGACYAAVLVESFNRDAVFDALLARRTYAATTKGILLDLRVDGAVMGEEVRAEAAPTVQLQVGGTSELAELVVFRNGEPVLIEGRPAQFPDHVVCEVDIVSGGRAGRVRDLGCEVSLEIRGENALLSPSNSGARRKRDFGVRNKGKHGVRWNTANGGLSGWGEEDRSFRLSAPIDELLRIRYDEEEVEITVGELLEGGFHGRFACAGGSTAAARRGQPFGLRVVAPEELRVDPSRGLGVREFRTEWVDDSSPPGRSWYYARVIQTDGEVAWSSPVFVERPETDPPPSPNSPGTPERTP